MGDGALRGEVKNQKVNTAFLANVVQRIPGWLNEFTAACLMDLLDMQDEQNWKGSLLEIGVYGGRLCSILAREAARTASHLVGLDPFRHFSVREVHDRLLNAAKHAPGVTGAASPRITLLQDFSANWTSDRLLAALGERSRFVHIDGSHKRDDVLWDLALADSVITPNSVIAVDDWLNVECVGVLEATFRFFQTQPRACAPFAFVSGKLLLCSQLCVAAYKSKLETFAAADTIYEQSKRYRHRLATDVSWIKQPLLDYEILVLV